MLADGDTATVLSPYRFGESAAGIEAATLVELADTARRVIALSLALPSRLADAGTLAEVLPDVDEDWLSFVLEPPDGLDGCLSRPDLVYSDGRFRCIDVNAAHAGGWLVHGCWTQQRGWSPAVADPLVAVCDMAHACARESGVATAGESVGLVVIRAPGSAEFTESVRHACLPAWRAAAARAGVTPGGFHFADYADLEVGPDGIYCAGERVHALLEGDVLDGAPRMRCVAAAKRGLVSLHSGPIAAVVNDRRVLAELSRQADEERPLLTPAERRLVCGTVAWTRSIRPGTTRWHGQWVDLPGLAVSRQPEMVLKHATSDGGTQVYLGHHTSPAAWRGLVENACDTGDWVVQEYLAPQWPPGASQTGPALDPIWSAFVLRGRYAGGLVRLLGVDDYPDISTATSMAESRNSDNNVRLAPIATNFELKEAK
ncbi:hypothetical protein B4U45_02305 [Mycobacterium persicum]|uniref:Uncharacterized protein n=1 Tax=Mycobacterium persicum TaxID=1487726 RepID=A0A8E2IPB3_9MYCO|nr:hypothetical protein A4G31_02280 [Mycobacterium persicum]ORB47531.1 hypothetical protein BST40_15425 [Mycobacterium persicum]ORB93589.1 hypothetical protein B1T44_02325 [Mycobacterium persicum]ORC05669.1 hypothetical protein B4U45_02305 [Mycobacterium persicum]VAZ76584.1 hypothetical protein LAUMK15_03372 [Mycobacterium persicum]